MRLSSSRPRVVTDPSSLSLIPCLLNNFIPVGVVGSNLAAVFELYLFIFVFNIVMIASTQNEKKVVKLTVKVQKKMVLGFSRVKQF